VNAYALAVLAVAAAYLIGAIPFGYLIFYWARGVDIRTVGSGNIGATNVGRQLGFRYFVLVFLLDVAKGFLPTWGFPRLYEALTGKSQPDLAVLVALATILGHNFPVYLRFRGGKGVATSLGALSALDPIASAATVFAFLVFLVVTRYVSLSSLMAGLVFMLAYFSRVERPWSRAHCAMTLLTFGLVGLLFIRHRANLARIVAGTEPKVAFKKKAAPPAGRSRAALVLVLAGGLAALGLFLHASSRPSSLDLGSCTMTEVARAGTGHQRADRAAFADRGNRLAVTCPRYDRLVIFRVTAAETLETAQDVALDGHPVALCVRGDHFVLLMRPPGDTRHVEPGWWARYDVEGRRVGSRTLVGFYPDDMVLTADGRHALVLTSGRAEGGPDRPTPALTLFQLDPGPPREVGRVTFDEPCDDPARIALSKTGRCAVVTLLGSKQAAAIDVSDPAEPRLIGRTSLPDSEVPYSSDSEGDSILMPVSSESQALRIAPFDLGPAAGPELVVSTVPRGSGLRVDVATTRRPLGRLVLRGPMGLGKTRPRELAYSPERGLLAVTNRAGGVHLVAIRPGAAGRPSASGLALSPDRRPR
jgi:glycerol-3-phosphate acyltransferase PlsY